MRPGGIGSGDEPPWPSQGMQVAEELETRIVDDDSDAESSDDWDHDSDSSPDEYPLHDPLQWMPALENLLYRDDSIANVLPGLDVHLVCHLLEIFTSLSSAQLRLLLSPPQIESQLSSGTMSRCLVLAACASAVRFSLHKAVARPDAKQFAEGIAREARKCIHISSDPNIQVNSIKSICILVDYSASKAHGRQAWADIGSDPEQPVKNIDFPGAPYLFVKEKAYRCESSADAVFGICRDIVRAKAFHSYATLVGFACTQSALVIMNQLHRSSKPYEPRIVGNLKTSLIILGALKTFYTPAEKWINILIQAHSSAISSSDHIDSAFNGFFNRFIGMHEPAFVPLDPGEKDAAKGSRATLEPIQTKERYGEQTSKIIGRAANRASDNGSEWLQAYAGHLSADIGPENAPNQLDASTNPTAIHDKQMDSSTTTETPPLPSANGEQVPDIFSTEPEVVELPDHMGAAILTAMSGNIRSSTPNLRDADPEQPGPAVVQHLAQENADNAFQTDFEPVSSFSELVGFNLELGVFPGLDLVVDGPDMFGVFNYDDTLGPTLSPSAFYM
ncbi:C6 transcription factor [Cordyceps javanica]|uniref:C6 transcription factor n=1 Tax=Cordyceps javanica TaxID=43265 RepID=A0A545V0R1_9HYPO|nr:C6 transcription factor [Cordyceps javanica]TQW05512.1 C6 transcription factor [Cordyceps javanica]